MKIPFNRPHVSGRELEYIEEALASDRISGSGGFTRKCEALLEKRLLSPKVLLTPSCTHALEMSALLIDIGPGDEVLVPSFTFVSTANAVVLRGATPVFVDIDPETKNMDAALAELAVTARTKAVFLVHYGGLACDMDAFKALGEKHDLFIVEDAAQAVGATYCGRPLGGIGDLGTFSFHETKNIMCGEGGALAVNNEKLIARAEIVQEKGTNRSKFFRGETDKYTWVDVGSSYLLGEIPAAYLFAQLQNLEKIIGWRLGLWRRYYDLLKPLSDEGLIGLPPVIEEREHNAHIFYVELKDSTTRDQVIMEMKRRGISCVFHYVPLHTSPMGFRLGYKVGDLPVTEKVSDTLLRLPLYNDLTEGDVETVSSNLFEVIRAI